ncbi:ephrin type-A receptor 2-like isoform X3 [Dendronephthya gigantea]|uniref:ephrin type-A receptor 2-like isoform X3 n=1 Tax=Dendronephthya gigantea TaxID=151771 RepID=UPI00106AF9C9|nr:ephrin type-A receptor 2-like isoform X3 [Dendronephthya gigantea]
MGILWFSVWILFSWYIVMLPSVHPEEVTVKDDEIKDWFGQRKELKKTSGESWVVKENIVYTCGIGTENDFWLITPYIDLSESIAEVINVDVEAELTLCDDPGAPKGSSSRLKCFSNYFEVYIYRGNIEETSPDLNYLTERFQPLYNITNDTSPNSIFTRRIKTFSFPQNHSQGVTFAIRSRGACGSIFKMKMYYYYCKEIFINGLQFVNTTSPAKGFKTVQTTAKTCSNNSVKSINAAGNKTMTLYIGYCFTNGTWSIPQYADLRCLCREGYTLTDGLCASCPGNTYKKNISNENCSQCPMNTKTNIYKTSCNCKEGYYKDPSAHFDPSPCYYKPSIKLLGSVVEITWKNAGIANETILYDVRCYECNQSICQTSCMNETYEPGQNNLTETKVVVSNLTIGGKYVFRVYAKNSSKKWKYVETNPFVFSIHVRSSTPTVFLATRTTGPSKPSSEPTKEDRLLMYIIIGVAAFLLSLLIVILIILLQRRRRNGRDRKTVRGLDNPVAVELPPTRHRNYVDPTLYADTGAALREFTNELDSNMVFLERMIGGGEFGDVYKGVLTTKDKKKIPVAIKTLKHDADAKSERDFMLEASAIGQFDNPNVVRMEGIITSSIPHMIVLEYMSNGSLEIYLKNNDFMLTNLQLIGMARGVAGGMKYLSGMNFVHRDLAARNILLNDDLLCKIADFGLSRELEANETSCNEYSTKGGRIPVRWTAPEAIKFRKFSTASDVWSFGILLWEIMSYAERPYWEWDNFKVMEQIDEGFRLPAPMNCPKGVHGLMLQCWEAERGDRPNFTDITIVIDRWIKSPEKMDDDINDLTPIGAWLKSIKMSRYEGAFVEAGYKSEEEITQITDADLISIGIHLIGHRNKIMKSIRSLKDEDKRESLSV